MARCRHLGKRRQCQFQAIDGSEFCEKHSNEEDRLNSYRFGDPELQKRFEHHERNSSLDTLRQEVILLRALIEERLSFARTEQDKVNSFTTVTSALATIDKLVNSLARLERAASVTLDKPALSRLGGKIVEILVRNLGDLPDRDDIVDRVAAEIAQAISEARNE